MLRTSGIHHITAIVNDPQVNVDFYSSVLGLKLVKKTINFDRPEVYHVYFGNETGEPGTIITFFPWPKLPKGRVGTRQVGTISYVIPIGSLEFWKERLKNKGVSFTVDSRFNETYLQFKDPDELRVELVERNVRSEKSWESDEVKKEHAIIGFGGAALYSLKPNQTAHVLENILGMNFLAQEGDYLRYQTEASLGNTLDVKLTPSVKGLAGAGTIHHIAWRAADTEELLKWLELLKKEKLQPTEIKDRNYFQALYFREAGGILFEIATDEPGFAVDEAPEALGTKLMLPNWLEGKREELEETLPPILVK